MTARSLAYIMGWKEGSSSGLGTLGEDEVWRGH